MGNIGVFTSGGDAPGMNACIRAVVRTAISKGQYVVVIIKGYQGMIEGNFVPLVSRNVSGIIHNGGTILKSARSNDFMTKEGRRKAYERLQAADVNRIVAIGGDGTFRGAMVFTKEFPDISFIGIPGTIDNDLSGTDYTLGFQTAVQTAVEAIDKIRDTADSHDRLFFVEVMGRDTGFIALECAIAAGAEAVLIPEEPTDIPTLADTLAIMRERKKLSSIVIVAEGDDAGGAYKIADQIKQYVSGVDMRVTVLGHLQRGGRPVWQDRILGTRVGIASIEALLADRKGEMAGIINGEVVFTPFEKVVERGVNKLSDYKKMLEILTI